jgi:hypothetical protein
LDSRTAFKLFIRDVVERTLNKSEDGSSYLEYDGQSVFTLRVMGIVVSKYDSEKFTILTLDDSTETVSVRAFGEDKDLLQGISVGDSVDVIGSLREYEEETYIVPWRISIIEDPNWELVRNLELLIRAKKTGAGVPSVEVLDEGRSEEQDLKPVILALIDKLDTGGGADYNALLKDSGVEDNQLDQALNDLLSSSDIYEPKIGRFRRV